jgi:hypothetical protein
MEYIISNFINEFTFWGETNNNNNIRFVDVETDPRFLLTLGYGIPLK